MNGLLLHTEHRRDFWPFIVISVILHLWLLLVLEHFSKISEQLQYQREETRPISVRLKKAEPVIPLMERNRPNLIEENPNANKEKVKDAEILSTENSSAQEGGGEGDRQPAEMSEQSAQQPVFLPNGAEGFSSSLIGKNLAAGGKSEAELEKKVIEDIPPPSPKNGIGASFSLSSYAWEWAPWVLDLKKKFGRTINPPPVYTRLGLVSGITRIKFVINRDGSLASYTVLSHQGHEVLEKTTIDAVEAVFPFKPLPDDFPDPKLIIIGNFIYPDLRKLYRR